MSGVGDGEDDPHLLAGEYVMGALPPEQARALEALALHDPQIARSIAEWQEMLTPLADALPKLTPPVLLWRRLALATGIETVISGPPAPRRGTTWSNPNLWRATTAAALALAACLGFLLLSRPAPLGEPLLAALSPAGVPGATFLVRVDAEGHATIVATADPATPEGRALELWALDAGAAAPVSLGVLPGAGRRELILPNRAGTKLLISQEPAGGSPTGKPTGPVVYSGTLTSA